MRRLVAKVVDRAGAVWGRREFPRWEREFAVMETWPRERWEGYRSERLGALLRHAVDQVPYWGELFRSLGAEPQDFRSEADLARLPVLTKEIINERSADLRNRGPAAGPLRHTSTGGSTGRNIWLTLDRATQDRRRAAGRRSEAWDGVGIGTRLATFWGAALDARPSRASRFFDALTGRLFLSCYGVGGDQIRAYFERLAAFRPEVITSYPSILLHAARQAGKTACRAVGARLIYCSAEALEEPVREELADLFGAAVRNRYASREFGLIASDCPVGPGLHTADWRFIIDSVGGGSGRPGELLITDLDNYSMPFIRYRIDDLAEFEAEPCRCGRTLRRLKCVAGRVLDVVTTPDGRAFGGTFFTLVFRPFDRSIRQFQVIQDRPDHLRIQFVPGENWDGAHREKLTTVLAEQLGAGMSIDLTEVPEIPPLASGKRRFVVSEIGGARRAG